MTTEKILEAMWRSIEENGAFDDQGSSPLEKRRIKRDWRKLLNAQPSRVAVKLGNQHWLVSSDSRPGDYHSVQYVGGSDYECSCEDHACRKRQCKHIDLIREVEQHV